MKTPKKIWQGVVVVLVSVIAVLSLILYQKTEQLKITSNSTILIDRENPIWSDFFDDDRPVLLVLGNHYFFEEHREKLGRNILIRDTYTNSDEELQILCTNQSDILNDRKKAHNDIYFDTDDKGPLLRVHPPHILSLLRGRDFVMTRYNGSDKLWIYREEFF